jgi:hypothetical protein
MIRDDRINEIITTIKKIQESKLPMKKYFENNFVPFSISRYYKYCNAMQRYGTEGLRDHREDANQTKLTRTIQNYILSTVKENRSISSPQLKNKILDIFGISLSEDTINIFNENNNPEEKRNSSNRIN